ncbi:septum formation initiator family protein [Streptomyces sp. ME01-24h]|nr:septum formation initiator family protein [Streptomyces sp. ME19-03-3]MDX3354456.1 septum formation initiator family protein [Streptomyces sp. ME01-24h]
MRRRTSAARSPFVLLIVLLLGGGLITLLLLNSAVNRDSFKLSELQKRTTQYTDEEQALQQEVDRYAEPDALDEQARELGMVPGGNPAFLAPDGTVLGSPGAAPYVPAPSPSTAPATVAPSGSAAASLGPAPSVTPSTSPKETR